VGHEMIRLTRLNHEPLVLNSDLIEHMEITPDTVITLTTGQKLMVQESADEVISRVIAFRRAIVERACQSLGSGSNTRPAPGETGEGANGG
ncbi:MAG: flagellar FlbD family protein, partial [Bryobacteraceae bacterium]